MKAKIDFCCFAGAACASVSGCGSCEPLSRCNNSCFVAISRYVCGTTVSGRGWCSPRRPDVGSSAPCRGGGVPSNSGSRLCGGTGSGGVPGTATLSLESRVIRVLCLCFLVQRCRHLLFVLIACFSLSVRGISLLIVCKNLRVASSRSAFVMSRESVYREPVRVGGLGDVVVLLTGGGAYFIISCENGVDVRVLVLGCSRGKRR